MKKKHPKAKFCVKAYAMGFPRGSKRVRGSRVGKADRACEDAKTPASEVSLRLLTKPDQAGQKTAGPTVDRSRLILVMNEKITLLADLSSCTEELVELNKREGRIDKQIQEMEELCIY